MRRAPPPSLILGKNRSNCLLSLPQIITQNVFLGSDTWIVYLHHKLKVSGRETLWSFGLNHRFTIQTEDGKLEPRFYCESGVERRIHEIFVVDYN